MTAPGNRRPGLPLAMPVPPPFPLVGAHFAAGFTWALLGGIGLVVLGPLLARGGFLDSRIIGLTHLITLGWITTVITGVLYQIFPAMLGIAAQSMRVAWYSLVLHTTGLAMLAAGLYTGWVRLQASAWLLLFAAVFGTAWNLLPQRRRAPRNRQLGLYVSYAHMGFGLAMAVGGVRIGDALGWWTTPRLGLLSAHFHLAAGGFVTMVLLGVGSRMIPMFLGAEGSGEPAWFETWLRRGLALGTVVFAAGMIAGPGFLSWGGAVLMAAVVTAALWRAAGWYRRRSARRLDPSTALLLAAFAWLGLSMVTGFDALARGLARPGVAMSYAVMILLGWTGASILAVSYRVLPNLAWHHRFGARARQAGTPSPARMVVPALGWFTLASHTAGLFTLMGGLHRASPVMVQCGAALFTAAVLATAIHHLRLVVVK
ncbi:MAG: NnrS family protein [Gemmatimonadota bacterium]|nr:NnrS family protein [Gemmatimonadota bacterium]